MANFELRIYEIPVDDEIYDKVIEEYKVHNVSCLTDEDFVKASEDYGNVYTLRGYLNQDVIVTDNFVTRAYFIDVDNSFANATGVTKPIRADGLQTKFKASEVTDITWTGEDRIIYKEVDDEIRSN